ncbi:MAG: polysaccharide biosynthesis protein, partial [Comamonadaceae bacterium]|nr:polysaccharide biosynthesis protein [Comamonadaceae bacterium]
MFPRPPIPASAPPLLRAVLTLLGGGALAQLLPLLLGPLLARLYTPEAFGLFTQFATVAAALAVAASLRYEQALPLAADEAEAQALLALCLRLLLAAALLAAPLGWALARLGALPWPWLLPLAVAASGLLQVGMLWANRARRFGALAFSRVAQYGGAAVLQVALGAWLWQASGAPAEADVAWTLPLAAALAALLAAGPLARPAPAGGWRGLWRAQAAPGGGGGGPGLRQRMAQAARRHRDFALVNTPHAFLGTAQDALAVALLAAWAGD